MDSKEVDYNQDTGSDWSEEDADWVEDGGEPDVDCREPYKILTVEDIKHLQENDISTVSGVLSVPRGVACALLCRNNWSLTSAYDHWFAAADGDGGERNPAPVQCESIQHNCKICYERTDLKDAASAACGHPFCADCLKSYIAAAVSGGAGCLTLECPEPGCKAAITSDLVEKLASAADLCRYNQYLLRSYVELSRNRKWCPAAGCDLAIELDAVGTESYDVICDCSTEFCWGCTGERHSPLSCTAATEWAESARWILANTKPCPKCRRPIEKSEGCCDHMICLAPCGFEFCWTCSERWTVEYQNSNCCSRCAARSRAEAEGVNEPKPKPEIFQGGNCYERWGFNEKSKKKAMGKLAKARWKYGGEESGETQFAVEAWEQIVEGWRVLNWSYVYVYTLPEVPAKRAVMEHFQAVAEGALAELQCRLEEQIEGDEGVRVDSSEFLQFRTEVAYLTKIANNSIESLDLAMKNEFESYAHYWEKEALELKNHIAIAESYAKDLEMEDVKVKNDIAILESYALDLEMASEKETLDSKDDVALDLEMASEKETRDSKDDVALDSEKETLDSKNDVAEVGTSASLDLKDDLAEVGRCALDREKEAHDVKNEFAESGSCLDSDKESNELNDLSEAESYVLVSDTDKEADFDESYVLVSEEEDPLLRETV